MSRCLYIQFLFLAIASPMRDGNVARNTAPQSDWLSMRVLQHSSWTSNMGHLVGRGLVAFAISTWSVSEVKAGQLAALHRHPHQVAAEKIIMSSTNFWTCPTMNRLRKTCHLLHRCGEIGSAISSPDSRETAARKSGRSRIGAFFCLT